MTYSKYPGAIDNDVSLPEVIDLVTEITAESVNRLRDAIIATESTIGANPTDGHATVKDRLDAMQSDIDSHASTHEDGGTDELTIQNLGSGSALANKVVVTDGAGGLSLQDYSNGILKKEYAVSVGTMTSLTLAANATVIGATYHTDAGCGFAVVGAPARETEVDRAVRRGGEDALKRVHGAP